ncbi:MAG: ferrous iron transport protein B [Clostridiales bacterium]|nr:MAG: ferrous iron transport protein B [Clostridiales bacterium]
MRIAMTGNPNSGKTTMFNAVTGKIEKVGNWPGVTIEKKEGPVKKSLMSVEGEMTVVDLPGAYSMSPYTSEESITSQFVKNEAPDVIINIVDATNLSRSLFFTTQLLELGIPVVVALNKSDLNEKKTIKIDTAKLSDKLGCKVVETVSTAGGDNGLKALVKTVAEVAGTQQTAPFSDPNVDQTDRKSVEASDKRRYEFVKTVVEAVETRQISSNQQTAQDAVDRVVAHPVLGILVFAVVMYLVFSISQTHVGPLLADTFVGWLESFQGMVADSIGEGVSPFLSALLVDGIIGGVIAVIGFLPLIMVLFFLLALLEDCGYMARVAVVMDRYLKKVGLSGKSIIPMVISTGCAIPGVMATRTIKNERQRRTTAMLAPFMPCGAKLPVIALFAGVFFNDASWVGTLMYFLALFVIIFGAMLVVRITGEKAARTFFIIELPDYRFPSIKRAVISTFSRAKAFIVKAGTIILVCNAVVQIMQAFNWQFQVVAEDAANTSILASISSPFALLLVPLGFGVWQLAAAAITGFIAKENVVGTLAVVYGISNFIDTEELALVEGASDVATIMGLTSVAALSYLVFNLFTPPCFAAIGSMNSEMESSKWLLGGVAFQFGLGYVFAFITYQVGTLITTGSLGAGFIPGAIVVAILIGIVVYLVKKGDEYAAAKLAMAAQK